MAIETTTQTQTLTLTPRSRRTYSKQILSAYEELARGCIVVHNIDHLSLRTQSEKTKQKKMYK
jgi:hypothetical protein